MSVIDEFKQECNDRVESYKTDAAFQSVANAFVETSITRKYSYNFSWLGRPIIQYPQDIVMMQEIIWDVKPDLIIETGIAHGGSIIFYASMLELLRNNGQVIGIDIDIREYNRAEIEKHPMFKRITMIEESSIDEKVIESLQLIANNKKKVLVCLDSNHTHDHVLRELELYAPFVSVGSYCVVFDTLIEDMSSVCTSSDRPWTKGNNPKTAVNEYLKTNNSFEIDRNIESKLLITAAPGGYLRRIK